MSDDDAPSHAPPTRRDGSERDRVERDGSERDPHARLAPAVATVFRLLPAPPALFFWGLSDMATDSCGPDDCSPELMSALDVVDGALLLGGPVVIALVADLPQG
ncbi:hypothetical protein [Streptomyces pseudogriseolus]|uniref:hypothetical protein n=1 Tax=Streptomyces pseudogriseolus TaxID=36817 RepID=UPI003FA28656